MVTWCVTFCLLALMFALVVCPLWWLLVSSGFRHVSADLFRLIKLSLC